jgi:PAS domain-containing protein
MSHSGSELTVVGPGETRGERLFCGRCGRSPETGEPARPTRVCPRCGMGLMLSAAADVAPTREDPFLVIDGALTIRAVSERAEELLGLTETEAVNEHVLNYLTPAEAEGAGPANLVALLARAATGETTSHDVVVRPRDEFGVRLWARVGACGPPTAALLVLATAR